MRKIKILVGDFELASPVLTEGNHKVIVQKTVLDADDLGEELMRVHKFNTYIVLSEPRNESTVATLNGKKILLKDL